MARWPRGRNGRKQEVWLKSHRVPTWRCGWCHARFTLKGAFIAHLLAEAASRQQELDFTWPNVGLTELGATGPTARRFEVHRVARTTPDAPETPPPLTRGR